MLDNARQLIEKYALDKRVAVAVSGGEDSMALLSLFSEYARKGALKLFAVNVDHGIRANSAYDSKFVKDFCENSGIEFYGTVTNIPELCKQSGRGIESEAHFFRKRLFENTIACGKADIVATAHHSRDNAETVLLHLFRGCGLKGLSGMKEMGDNGIFRPFINTAKEEICAYVRDNDIPFVNDETNFINDYDRNYIRNVILPKVKERFPSVESAVLRCARFASEANSFISARLDESAFVCGENCVSVKEEFLSAPYIFEALARLGKNADVYSSAIDTVLNLRYCKPCARADIGDGITAAREYGVIAFYKAAEGKANEEVPYSAPFDGFVTVKILGNEIVIERNDKPSFPLKKGMLAFDSDKIPLGSVWRARRDGDLFTPYGGGTKKLKEYFIDKKIPQRLRGSIPLLCCGNKVLIVAGYEISDSVKTDGESKHVCSVRAEKERE